MESVFMQKAYVIGGPWNGKIVPVTTKPMYVNELKPIGIKELYDESSTAEPNYITYTYDFRQIAINLSKHPYGVINLYVSPGLTDEDAWKALIKESVWGAMYFSTQSSQPANV